LPEYNWVPWEIRAIKTFSGLWSTRTMDIKNYLFSPADVHHHLILTQVLSSLKALWIFELKIKCTRLYESSYYLFGVSWFFYYHLLPYPWVPSKLLSCILPFLHINHMTGIISFMLLFLHLIPWIHQYNYTSNPNFSHKPLLLSSCLQICN